MTVIPEGLGGVPLPSTLGKAQVVRNSVTEQLTPEPDGVRRVFYTSQPYRGGTLSVWKNGLRKIRDWEDGFVEILDDVPLVTGGTPLVEGLGAPAELVPSGVEWGTSLQMQEPPMAGDSLQAQYEPVPLPPPSPP